jgi:dTMP kinase
MKLIIVDGMDAVGKDTHAQLIYDRYIKKGFNVIKRSHPSDDNFFGRKAKKSLLKKGKINKIGASIFYMFDVLRSIRKYYRIEDEGVIIMVRYLMGTAYLPKRLAGFAYNFFKNFVPISDYMFFLDASPKELYDRVEKRDVKEIFETLEELNNVRNKALILTKDWNVIDTNQSIEDTYKQIEIILDKLDNKKLK